MLRTILTALFATLLLFTWNAGFAPEPTAADNHLTSGQGDYKFKVVYKGSHLPQEAQAVLEKAHGGFAIDRRDGKGEVYFALPGAGIIQISSDLERDQDATHRGRNEAAQHAQCHDLVRLWRRGPPDISRQWKQLRSTRRTWAVSSSTS